MPADPKTTGIAASALAICVENGQDRPCATPCEWCLNEAKLEMWAVPDDDIREAESDV